MTFLKRKDTSKLVKVEEVYVVKTYIVSSYDDGTEGSPRCVTLYFLAKCNNGEYYELFSNKKLEREGAHDGIFAFGYFDRPYVVKAEPLSNYLEKKDTKEMDIQTLFDFIVNMNVLGKLGGLKDSENEEE